MEINPLRCPACGATAPANIKPNEQFRCPACGSVLVLTDTLPADRVRCARCHTLNDGTNQYCARCGSALQIHCPFCYAPNETDAAFCVRCGANIYKALKQKAEWLAQKKSFDTERQAALEQALAREKEAEMERLLQELDEPANHPYAIYCLREYGSKAVEPLSALLRDDDPDARFGAAHTLGLIGDTRAVPALMQALSDPEPAVRWWALDALGKMRAARAKPEITKLLKDKHRGVREHAANVLRSLDEPAA